MNYRWLFNNNWVSLLINYKYEGTYRYGSERILDLGIESIEILETQFESASAAKSLQSYPTLRDPIDSRPPGSPVPGILQARTLEWVAISFSSAWKWEAKVKSLRHVWLSDPMDCSLPGCSVHGIFQARVLEWGTIAFSEKASRS